jgi:ornithine carbamoyltransferase
MPSNPRSSRIADNEDAQSIAKALHRLLDIIALRVVEEFERERLGQKPSNHASKTLVDDPIQEASPD